MHHCHRRVSGGQTLISSPIPGALLFPVHLELCIGHHTRNIEIHQFNGTCIQVLVFEPATAGFKQSCSAVRDQKVCAVCSWR